MMLGPLCIAEREYLIKKLHSRFLYINQTFYENGLPFYKLDKARSRLFVFCANKIYKSKKPRINLLSGNTFPLSNKIIRC